MNERDVKKLQEFSIAIGMLVAGLIFVLFFEGF